MFFHFYGAFNFNRMNILIAYATNSGSTKEAARVAQEVFEAAGHSVVLKRANAVNPSEFSSYGLIVFASCTWELITPTRRFEGQLHAHFIALRDKLKGKEFPESRFAVLGVGDSTYTNFCIAANHLVALVRQLKGTQVGETLRLDKFFFHLPENRRIVKTWARSIVTAFQNELTPVTVKR